VAQAGRAFTDEELSQGRSIVFPGKANESSQRIRAARKVTGQTKEADGKALKAIKLVLGAEFYFEERELRSRS
jgi:hypothetical protein